MSYVFGTWWARQWNTAACCRILSSLGHSSHGFVFRFATPNSINCLNGHKELKTFQASFLFAMSDWWLTTLGFPSYKEKEKERERGRETVTWKADFCFVFQSSLFQEWNYNYLCFLLQYAHRRCVQRWCNEKGNITCEICHQVCFL